MLKARDTNVTNPVTALPVRPKIALPVYTDTEKAVAMKARLNLSVDEIAAELDLSTRQVRRCLKSVGIKTVEIRRLFVEHAKGRRISELNDQLLEV